jgi:hypothetical protein
MLPLTSKRANIGNIDRRSIDIAVVLQARMLKTDRLLQLHIIRRITFVLHFFSQLSLSLSFNIHRSFNLRLGLGLLKL